MDNYDLQACLEENPQDAFTANDIKIVLAVWEGENEADSWRWIFQLNSDKYVLLEGWCDYTGWDCQSGAFHVVCDSPNDALEYWASGDDLFDFNDLVYSSLKEQLTQGKNPTWRDKMNAKFGLG